MSDRLTGIQIEGDNGLAEWGLYSHDEMVAKYRAYGERLRARADAILDAAPEDFIVETYLGPIAMRKRERIFPK